MAPNSAAQDEGDHGQAEPLEDRPLLAIAARTGSGHRRSLTRLASVLSHRPISEPAIGAARAEPWPPCSTITAIATCGIVGRGVADEPRVRLGASADLGRARLARRGDARDRRAGREDPAPRTFDRETHGRRRSCRRPMATSPSASASGCDRSGCRSARRSRSRARASSGRHRWPRSRRPGPSGAAWPASRAWP